MNPLTCQVSAKYSPDNIGLFPFKRHLEGAGFEVAYPVGEAIIEYTLGFAVTVPSERETPFHLTEIDFLRKVASSDVQVMYDIWANLDGYVGESTAIETAFAMMIGRPIVAVRPMSSFSPELAPEIAEILLAHDSALLTRPLDKMSTLEVRTEIAHWMKLGPARAFLSPLETAEIGIQVAQLTSKYQTTWADYERLRSMTRSRTRDELVKD